MPEGKTDIVITVLAICLFTILLMVAVVMIFRIYMKRKNKLLLEKRMLEVQFEQTLLQSQLEIQEQTFKNISGELHDNINQVLSLVRLNLNTLETDQQEKIDRIDGLLGKAIIDLRNLSHSLDTDHIRHNGWHAPVTKLLRNLESTGNFRVTVKIDAKLPAVESEKGIILFRIIQESVNNIIKHSAATTIEFEARDESGKLYIRLADNGTGFDPGSATGGVGLRNLVNRAKMIDAKLRIVSAPGQGTTIFLSTN